MPRENAAVVLAVACGIAAVSTLIELSPTIGNGGPPGGISFNIGSEAILGLLLLGFDVLGGIASIAVGAIVVSEHWPTAAATRKGFAAIVMGVFAVLSLVFGLIRLARS